MIKQNYRARNARPHSIFKNRKTSMSMTAVDNVGAMGREAQVPQSLYDSVASIQGSPMNLNFRNQDQSVQGYTHQPQSAVISSSTIGHDTMKLQANIPQVQVIFHKKHTDGAPNRKLSQGLRQKTSDMEEDQDIVNIARVRKNTSGAKPNEGGLTAIDESPLGKPAFSSFKNSRKDLDDVESALGEVSMAEVINREAE